MVEVDGITGVLRWWAHVRYLADDALEGRDTGSPGHEKAAEYMADQFRSAGLEPTNDLGYRQPLDLNVSRIEEARCSLELLRDGRGEPLRLGVDAAIFVHAGSAEELEADAIFVGHGLTVPELGYDDLAGQDVQGKVVVLVGGGPSQISGPIASHYQSDRERRGFVLKRGAVGVIFLPNPKHVELPWSRRVAGRLQPTMELCDPAADEPAPLPLGVLFNTDRAEKLFAGSGHAFEEVLAALHADRPLPRFPLAVRVRARIARTLSRVRSENVAGVLPGSDPDLRREYVVVSAHLDHVGIGEPVHGDPIYSGAMDDAAGDASLIEIARSLGSSDLRPRRSILFLSVTGEEKGLLGSEYFAAHPTVSGPIVADLNMDMFLPLYPLTHLQVQGLSESSLGEDVRAVAEARGVTVQPDLEPEHNHFIRSDQYSFVRRGIPALAFRFGYLPGTPEERTYRAWYAERYHAPSDDIDQPVDLEAAAQFNTILAELALRVARADPRPAWVPESFFARFAK